MLKVLVAGEGFEPSKAEPGDLQSPRTAPLALKMPILSVNNVKTRAPHQDVY